MAKNTNITMLTGSSGDKGAKEMSEEAGYGLNLKVLLDLLQAVQEFVTYYQGPKKSHLGNGQAYKSHSRFEQILAELRLPQEDQQTNKEKKDG